LLGRGGRHVLIFTAGVRHLAHCIKYKCCMPNADVAAYIGRWRSSSVSPQAAAFARDVITAVRPEGKERAKNLLWAAGKLAGYAIGLGLEPVPEVVLHPSAAERFTRCAPGLSPVARRTLRTNLRFIGRRLVPQFYPADLPLPRERAKKPYSPAEIGGFLALAGAQPTMGRRMRAAGLVCLGAGAGLIRSDLRDVRGGDVACRSGGVMVTVRGTRPRAVPVLARYHARLLAAARFAGSALICGGADPGRRNITNPLIIALDGGSGLPRLDTSRLRATWLAEVAELLGLATFMHAAGISCSQRLGDLVAGLEPAGEADAVRLLGAARRP
jgi:integrase